MDLAKDSIRKNILNQRKLMSAGEVAFRSNQIYQTFQEKFEQNFFQAKQNFGLYYPIQNEVLTHPWYNYLRKLKKNICYPAIVQNKIFFTQVTSLNELYLAKLGLHEPVLTNLSQAVIPDIILVPGVAFASNGYRIGYGKGFFDRFMIEHQDKHLTYIGLGYSFQCIDNFPHSSVDQKINFLISEDKIINFSS